MAAQNIGDAGATGTREPEKEKSRKELRHKEGNAVSKCCCTSLLDVLAIRDIWEVPPKTTLHHWHEPLAQGDVDACLALSGASGRVLVQLRKNPNKHPPKVARRMLFACILRAGAWVLVAV